MYRFRTITRRVSTATCCSLQTPSKSADLAFRSSPYIFHHHCVVNAVPRRKHSYQPAQSPVDYHLSLKSVFSQSAKFRSSNIILSRHACHFPFPVVENRRRCEVAYCASTRAELASQASTRSAQAPLAYAPLLRATCAARMLLLLRWCLGQVGKTTLQRGSRGILRRWSRSVLQCVPQCRREFSHPQERAVTTEFRFHSRYDLFERESARQSPFLLLKFISRSLPTTLSGKGQLYG